ELQEILWNCVRGGPAGTRLDWLERELERATTQLKELRAGVDRLTHQLADKERRADWLEARVQIYTYVADRANAWQYALELDGLRNTLKQERARLQQRRQAYQRQLARVRQLQDRLDDLQFGVYSNG